MKKYQPFVRQPRTKPLSARGDEKEAGTPIPKASNSSGGKVVGGTGSSVPVSQREEVGSGDGPAPVPVRTQAKRDGYGYNNRVYRAPRGRTGPGGAGSSQQQKDMQPTGAKDVAGGKKGEMMKPKAVEVEITQQQTMVVSVQSGNKENHPSTATHGARQGPPQAQRGNYGNRGRNGWGRGGGRFRSTRVIEASKSTTSASTPTPLSEQPAVPIATPNVKKVKEPEARVVEEKKPIAPVPVSESKPKKSLPDPDQAPAQAPCKPVMAPLLPLTGEKTFVKPFANGTFLRSTSDGEVQNMGLIRKPQNDHDPIVRRLHPRFNGPREFDSFDTINLRPEVLQGIKEYGILIPSDCQRKMLKPIMSGRDLICQAQSGMGKTVAYAIGILTRISPRIPKTQVLILANTRELAEQIVELVREFGKHIQGLRVQACIGGTDYEEEADKLHGTNGPQVIVGTVGRVAMLMLTKDFIGRFVRTLVLDEGDKMVTDISFRGALRSILFRLPGNTQIVLTSATMSPEALRLSLGIVRNPEVFLVSKETLGRGSVKQFYVSCESSESVMDLLVQIIKPLENYCKSGIIFCNTRGDAKEIKAKLNGSLSDGQKIGLMLGDVAQEERLETLRQFRSGIYTLLISTDVLGRGIDVENVQLVVNVGMPYNKQEYLHRIGRTGRFGRDGIAVTLLLETNMAKVRRLEEYYAITIHPLPKMTEWAGLFGAPIPEPEVEEVDESDGSGESGNEAEAEGEDSEESDDEQAETGTGAPIPELELDKEEGDGESTSPVTVSAAAEQ